MQTIRQGSKGSDVVIWQNILNAGPKPSFWKDAAGNDKTWPSDWVWPLAADGDFGQKTTWATESWQSLHNLIADGVVGPKTWAASGTPSSASVTPPGRSFIQARSYNKISNKRNTLIVIHDMEYPEKLTAAEDVAKWFAGPTAPRASAHYCVDSDSIVQCVKDEDVAWHTPGRIGSDYVNNISIGIEHAGYARQTREEWLDPYSKAMLLQSAKLTADLCIKFNIPVRRLTDIDIKNGNQAGITGHVDCTKGTGTGDHVDPGPGFPWDWYLEQVQEFVSGTESHDHTASLSAATWVEVVSAGLVWEVAPIPLAPVGIGEAQSLADRFDCVLPSKQLVDDIWRAADLKLDATKLMDTSFVTWSKEEMNSPEAHARMKARVDAQIAGRPFRLLAGAYKDVILTSDGRLALYGWHRLDGTPVQPVYTGHSPDWKDYSQSVRLCRKKQ